MLEIDFLSIEKTGDAGSKSGDAIAVRFDDAFGFQRVVIIDGGYKDSGERLVEHVQTEFETEFVDLVISTHPDNDHLSGLTVVLEELAVGELLIHRPHLHTKHFKDYSNIEVIDAVIALAEKNDVTVTEPFTGLTRFNGAIRVLGPTQSFYEELLEEDLGGGAESVAKSILAMAADRLRESAFGVKSADLLSRVLTALPYETLSEDGETSPRNRSSVITLLDVDGYSMFTGDAGIDSLVYAAEQYEAHVGSFAENPLRFFQAPHHGSHRNLAPSLLDRIFGKKGDTFSASTSFISSAKADPKHPSPRVTNALARRDVTVYATEGKGLLHHNGSNRPGWSAATPIPPLNEDDE